MIAYVGIDAHTTNYTLSTYLEGSAVTAKSKCPESDLIICPETAHLGDFE